MDHNLNFQTSDCHTLQLGKQKKAKSVIVENNPLKEQKNLCKAWFNIEPNCCNAYCCLGIEIQSKAITHGIVNKITMSISCNYIRKFEHC